jgi:4-amino-4-deoxy-L-arabinose transferase-like glycosyltransferase
VGQPLSHPSSRRYLILWAVLGLTAVLCFARLDERSLWSEEVRWAEIPREMLRAEDLFRPTFNGRLYYDKPLGSYWLVLVAARITGGIGELAARLPSAVSALMAVVFLMLIARRLYGRRVAAVAGAILASSFGFTFFARTASADTETVCGVLAALWLFVRNKGWAGPWLLLFWLVMALTSLTKGLLGFALPLLVIGVYSGLAPRDSRGAKWVSRFDWLFNRITLLAIPMAAAVYLAPFLFSGGGVWDGLRMVYRENIRRFYDPVNHRGPIYVYGYVIFELLAPWSVFLPVALIRPTVGSCRDRFALSFFWTVFIFFTLSASRRSYYLLPVLPAAALLIAVVLTRRSSRLKPLVRGLRSAGIWLIGFGLLIAPIVLMPPIHRPAPLDQYPALPAPGALVATWSIAVAALAVGVMKPRRIAGALVVIAFALQGYLFVFFLPAAEAYRTQRPFAAAIRERLGPDLQHVGLYQTSDIVYYLDPPGPLPEFHDPTDLRRAADAREIHWVITRRRDRDALGAGWLEVAGETVHSLDSADQAQTKLLLLQFAGQSGEGRRK